uniref:MoaB/Mog domain-containing protein n=1 Tax=Parascaris univalens TaxID=6257 RepID=A0A915B2Q0_PARUN
AMEDNVHIGKESAIIQRPRHSPWPAIAMAEAKRIVDEHFAPGASKLIQLSSVREGDVLFEDIVATRPQPEVRTSIKDGYAVIASDGAGVRDVIHKTTAGILASITLQPNTVCRVNTGSMVPDGADAVVQIEDTRLVKHNNVEELSIEVLSIPKIGQDIREVGSDIAVGDLLLPKHTVLRSAEIGILAGSQRKSVRIFRRPKVAVMSTGHELVDCEANDCPLGLIRDTNRPQLLALFRACCAKAFDIGIVPDSEEKLVNALNEAFALADIVVSSGGVSMGEKDYLKSVIQEKFKFKIHFGRVMMKPGLPTTFATGLWKGQNKAIFALPGNPVSAWVTAQLFVMPALRKTAGYANYWPTTIKVKVTESVSLDSRPEYRRAWLRSSNSDVPEAVCTSTNQLSSRMLNLRGANLLLVLPARSDTCSVIEEGHIVDALIIGTL